MLLLKGVSGSVLRFLLDAAINLTSVEKVKYNKEYVKRLRGLFATISDNSHIAAE